MKNDTTLKKHTIRLLLYSLLCLLCLPSWANTLQFQSQYVPPPLQPWVNWVLHDLQGYKDYTCPPQMRDKEICHWPSLMTLNINATQAEFSQKWQVYNAGWITLPGNAKHWPQQVKINDVDAIVADRAGIPSIFASKGELTLQGQFHFSQIPEFLPIPVNTGLIALTINGSPVTIPRLDHQGRLWLRQRGMTTEATVEDRLDMRVYRHIIDDIPLQVTMRMELEVAGRPREVVLGPVLLDKHQPMSIKSPLPARLEADGRLRLQVRPGSWTVTLRTRQVGAVNKLTFTPPEEGQWVDQEVWVFEARNDLRVVEIHGVSAIDPQQTALPKAWRKFPAYQMKAGNTLKLVEKRRGDPEPAPDRLTLERYFWLDFDGKGYTIKDRIGGTMTRGWRLEMAEPAILGRVAVNHQDQFITRLKEDSNAGVEVRRGDINLVADSRLEEAVSQLPAVGWAHDFENVQATLHLPPGWRLFSATGVDDVPGTWLKKWTLLEFFIVLIMAVAVAKLWRWWWGGLTLVTMVLIFHETKAPHWVWLGIIISLALLKVLPTLGWFSRSVRLYRDMSLLALLIIALPFMMQQMRQSIYPQLKYPNKRLVQSGFHSQPGFAAFSKSRGRFAFKKGKSGFSAKSDFAEKPVQTPEIAEYKWSVKDAESKFDDQRQQEAKPMLRSEGRYQSPIVSPSGDIRSKLVQISPEAKVQTGPGLPQWGWHSILMRWSGPVQQEQSLHLWLLSPPVNSMLSVARVILLALLITFFLWVSWGSGARLKAISGKKSGFTEKCPDKKNAHRKTKVNIALLLVGLCFLSLPLVSYADEASNSISNVLGHPQVNGTLNLLEKSGVPFVGLLKQENKEDAVQLTIHDFPPQPLLDELRNRLLKEQLSSRKPKCSPYCAFSPRLDLALEAKQLTLRMEIHSHADVVVPLPGIAKQWLPQQVLLNGKSAQNLWRDKKGQLWINLIKGIHQVQMVGTLPNRHTVQLPLPLKPHFVKVKAVGWRIEGVHENGIADAQLQFTREQSDKTRLAELEMGSLPPFVQVERTLLLGVDWQVITHVERITPLGTAIVLEIPLLKGESVTSEGIRVEKGHALINMPSNRSYITWKSVLAPQKTLTLIAPDNTFSTETWRLDASAIWHVEIEGIPVVHHQAEGRWLPEWRPLPGESVTLHLSRPTGAAGQVLTIDSSQLTISPGQRSTDNRLLLSFRSSRGLQHKITLPENAQLQSVKINGKSHPIRQEGRFVTLPMMPGEQHFELLFQQPTGMRTQFNTSPVDLGIDSVNTHIEIKMPKERWILFTGGKPIGPAVMIWGLLIVIVLVSIGLGQISLTPLNTIHWLLLGVVLSQVPVIFMLCVVAWFMVLGFRARISPDMSPLRFDAIQIGIAITTITALSILLFAITQGLLGNPSMHIAGNGSSAYNLLWYEDHSEGILPQVWVFSFPMLVYRIAMLLWALWLSFALLRWLHWGWESFSQHGLWKSLFSKKAVRT